jgi:hypothetical protein
MVRGKGYYVAMQCPPDEPAQQFFHPSTSTQWFATLVVRHGTRHHDAKQRGSGVCAQRAHSVPVGYAKTVIMSAQIERYILELSAIKATVRFLPDRFLTGFFPKKCG